MSGHCARRVRFTALAALLGTIGVASLEGQDPREAQVARAFREFDPTARQQLLIPLLNPSLGPLRGAWPVGVQLLAQTLIEDGKDSIAAAWLRWAIRLAPDVQPDTVLFLPEVVTAYRSARAFVMRTAGSADSVAGTTWLWPPQGGEREGRLQIAASGDVPVRVEVRGVGPIAAGTSVRLAPGSYELSAVASGGDTARVTREVLPGLATVVDFSFRSAAPLAAAQQSRGKKRFPVIWVGLAAAGVAGAVALLASGGETEPPARTGTITVTFPTP